MLASYTKASRNPSGLVKHLFDESVFRNDLMTAELRTTLKVAVSEAPRGSMLKAPKLDNLLSNMSRSPSVNHFCENAVFISRGLLHFAGLDAARRLPLAWDAMICASVPKPCHSLDELQKAETRIEGKLNDLQMAYATGDKSTQTKQKMLEDARKHRAALDELIAELERELYGTEPKR